MNSRNSLSRFPVWKQLKSALPSIFVFFPEPKHTPTTAVTQSTPNPPAPSAACPLWPLLTTLQRYKRPIQPLIICSSIHLEDLSSLIQSSLVIICTSPPSPTHLPQPSPPFVRADLDLFIPASIHTQTFIYPLKIYLSKHPFFPSSHGSLSQLKGFYSKTWHAPLPPLSLQVNTHTHTKALPTVCRSKDTQTSFSQLFTAPWATQMARERLCRAAKERTKERARETQREKLQGNKGNNDTERDADMVEQHKKPKNRHGE